MSNVLVNRVKRVNLGMGYGAKYILFLLADISLDGETVMISEEQLVEYSEYSIRAVRTHLRALEGRKIVIAAVRGDGRGRRSLYRLDLDRAEMDQGFEEYARKPRKPRKTRLEPTNAPEPLSSLGPVGEPESIAPPDVPIQTIDVEALRERRARIQALIKKAQAGEKNAVWWWEREGSRAMETLETINLLIGLEVEVPVG